MKTVAQKLVTIESFSAKIASGAVSAAQKAAEALARPEDKDRSQRQQHQRQHQRDQHVPMLKGRTTSKPRTCRMDARVALTTFLSSSL